MTDDLLIIMGTIGTLILNILIIIREIKVAKKLKEDREILRKEIINFYNKKYFDEVGEEDE